MNRAQMLLTYSLLSWLIAMSVALVEVAAIKLTAGFGLAQVDQRLLRNWLGVIGSGSSGPSLM